ncbi:hypothetical protein CDAR_70421 [Caerostris darwini]|uniref:Uncharacterized protein n=1 Tax=Caerostris darwini TaxID=1538125 RepID=A0AAV4PJV1_9ARAC|nr:hypothetical protein CDAR_70421 [Caerostris darwini]
MPENFLEDAQEKLKHLNNLETVARTNELTNVLWTYVQNEIGLIAGKTFEELKTEISTHTKEHDYLTYCMDRILKILEDESTLNEDDDEDMTEEDDEDMTEDESTLNENDDMSDHEASVALTDKT